MSASSTTHLSLAGRQHLLARLAQSHRVFDRLDWSTVAQWAGSPALHFNEDVALLMTPADLTPLQRLDESQLGVAWVRWCAVADGTSASPVVPRMIDAVHDALCCAGISEAFGIVHPQDWLLSYLHDAGYQTIDRMLTFEVAPDRVVAAPASPHMVLREVFAKDLPIIEQIDARCFAPAWRYPPALMQPAFHACAVFLLAEWRGAPVGYCCALLNDDHGHVVRLAVDAPHRNAGIGAAMLAQGVRALGARGARAVSLNTQGANVNSQRLYARMGFDELMERPMVLHKPLATPAQGRAGA